MTRLSININKLATLRNARGGNNPDVVAMARRIEDWGAEGITVHPRPDERHIRRQDVADLKDAVRTELNIEGYPDERYLQICEEARPAQATLVPDAETQLTSDHGWAVSQNADFLAQCVERLHRSGIRVSLFIDPVPEEAEAARAVGADRVELYTEPFATAFAQGRAADVIEAYRQTALRARAAGLGVNAGHDLCQANLGCFLTALHGLVDEVSIGHAVVCEALVDGFPTTIRRYLDIIRAADGGTRADGI